MAIEKKEIQYAKEVGDVLVLLCEIVKDIKAGKGVAELTSENLPNLIAAVGGADQIKSEIANKPVLASTVGYHVGDLIGAFLPMEAPAEQPAG